MYLRLDTIESQTMYILYLQDRYDIIYGISYSVLMYRKIQNVFVLLFFYVKYSYFKYRIFYLELLFRFICLKSVPDKN